jgi:hypothetical protein
MKEAADMLRSFADRIEAGEYESAEVDAHAFSRETTGEGDTARRHELTGSQVVVLKLQKAKKVDG